MHSYTDAIQRRTHTCTCTHMHTNTDTCVLALTPHISHTPPPPHTHTCMHTPHTYICTSTCTHSTTTHIYISYVYKAHTHAEMYSDIAHCSTPVSGVLALLSTRNILNGMSPCDSHRNFPQRVAAVSSTLTPPP